MRNERVFATMRTRQKLPVRIVALSLAILVGLVATPAGAKEKKRTYPSRTSFKIECEFLGGEYRTMWAGDDLVGFLCLHSGGGATQCGLDWSDPENCTVYPAGKPADGPNIPEPPMRAVDEDGADGVLGPEINTAPDASIAAW